MVGKNVLNKEIYPLGRRTNAELSLLSKSRIPSCLMKRFLRNLHLVFTLRHTTFSKVRGGPSGVVNAGLGSVKRFFAYASLELLVSLHMTHDEPHWDAPLINVLLLVNYCVLIRV